MFEFFSAFFSQRNTIKEDKQTNKTMTDDYVIQRAIQNLK